MAILIFVTVIAQCLLFQVFEIASIKPNLLLILTCSFGLMRGRTSGLLTGFFSGLTLDILFPGQLGMQALIYMWIGYFSGYCYRIFYDDDIKTPRMLVTIGDLVYGKDRISVLPDPDHDSGNALYDHDDDHPVPSAARDQQTDQQDG